MGGLRSDNRMYSAYFPIKVVDRVKAYCVKDGIKFNGLLRELLVDWLEDRDEKEAVAGKARKALRGGGSGW